MDKKTARNRWSLTAEANKQVEIITKILLDARSLERKLTEIVGKTDQGLLDLRGIPLSFESGMELKRVEIRETDFSYAQLGQIVLKQCAFDHVIFREIESSRWNERASHFTNVDFAQAKLRDAAIGIDGSIYKKVSFQGVDFTGASFYRPQFTNCDFSHAKLQKLDFYVSNFVNCKFCGKLKTVWFRRYYPIKEDEKRMGVAVPNEMRNVDFSEASLWDAVFTGGLDLSSIVLPKDGSHILLYHFNTALEKTRCEIEKLPWTDNEKNETFIWINAFLTHARSQPMWILNKKEMIEQLGEKVGSEFIRLVEVFDK